MSYDQLACCHRNCEQILMLAPSLFAWQFFADSVQHALINVVTPHYPFDVEIHAGGRHFHVGNCRKCGQML